MNRCVAAVPTVVGVRGGVEPRKDLIYSCSSCSQNSLLPKKVRVSLVTWRPIGSMASYKTPCLTSYLAGTEVKALIHGAHTTSVPAADFVKVNLRTNSGTEPIHSDKPKYKIQQTEDKNRL